MSTPILSRPGRSRAPRSRALRTCPAPRPSSPAGRRLTRGQRRWPTPPWLRSTAARIQRHALLAWSRLRADDRGMSTVEYAIGTLAAAGFAALLYTVVSGDNVLNALTGLVQRALETTF